jgi:phosphopantothenoylcysteine decarboxylase / phosphopantothenate---cysteine ligase
MPQPSVLLGISGGIAAYKSADLLRGLQRAGIEVRVMMTPSATDFVTPLTFETLSGHPVHLDGDLLRNDSAITHVEEGRIADLMVVAPATANTMAKMAQGLADNLLLSTYLAFAGTVVVAPAMNTNMWLHPTTQRSVAQLREDGVIVVEPAAGELACGVYGSGRMAEPESIVAEVKLRLQVERKTDLRGLRVVITAGGTREPIDAVRYIGNRSSGKMGYALARAAFDRGAQVDLIKANIDLPPAPGVEEISTPTAREMYQAVMERLPETDILIMAAAVADYQVAEGAAGGKISKSREDLAISLEPTTDILCEVAAQREDQFIVGFAAEYGPEGVARARGKLDRKNLDMIVFNDISRGDIGFNSDYNEVVVLTPEGELPVGRAPKETVAEVVLDQICRARQSRRLLEAVL